MAKSGKINCLAIAVWLAAAHLAGGAGVAAAQTLEFDIVEGTRFTMEPPNGLCRLDPNAHEADRILFESRAETHRPENKLVAVLAECNAVNAIRTAYPNGPYPTLERWVHVMTPLVSGKPYPVRGTPRAEVVDRYARLEDADAAVPLPRAIKELESAPADSDEERQLGRLARDQVVLITGVIARGDEGGKKRLIAGALGTTKVGDYVVSVNHFRTYARRDTFDALVAEIRQMVGDLIKRNGK